MLAQTRGGIATRTFRTAVTSVFAAATVIGGTAIATADAPAPAPQELQSSLDRFVDPAVPAAAKTKLIVGGERRVANIEKMNQGLANYGKVGFNVSDVRAKGDTADARVAVVSPHGTMPGVPMSWQHTAAGWQLSDGTACVILAMGKAPC
ncbi:hypothetical protein [Nocardia macrotermitis]|uniref:Low molecular weight antigen MTB12-like C-terminal domain-containing protein n=1 Tax=Nocardia macrotermitis TaxID=2585198 RepID=A0A7K0CX91_9NOCA|nr:hypothetical protein [Nocardia macrotermitis]MQY17274.1 hypothetical protein [Nocardia macrotermitis]